MFSDLRLQRFRSYRDESFEFEPGVNIIVGPNASGKTNLLEALLVICRGSSFRAKDAELVAFGAPWVRLDAHGPEGSRTVKLLVQDSGFIKKEFVISNQKLQRLSLAKTIPFVLFEPNHLLLLNGSPELRRDYLDTLLEQLVTGYASTRREYRRALAQRNALLKRGHTAAKQLFAWNIRLSEIGARLATERHALTERIQARLGDLYQDLAHAKGVTVRINYQTAHDLAEYSSSLLHTLEKRQGLDIERGFTSAGPHRDDLVLTFNDRPAAEVASRGETRTVLLALKLLELSFIEEARGKKPLLLLDDVFSELDGARRHALTEIIEGYQTFITTTDADVVVQHFMDSCHIIPL
jgi:DNA replication and repair protein RecF